MMPRATLFTPKSECSLPSTTCLWHKKAKHQGQDYQDSLEKAVFFIYHSYQEIGLAGFSFLVDFILITTHLNIICIIFT